MSETPHMGDYPPGCSGPPEESKPLDEDIIEAIRDEITDRLYDFQYKFEATLKEMVELDGIITNYIDKHKP